MAERHRDMRNSIKNNPPYHYGYHQSYGDFPVAPEFPYSHDRSLAEGYFEPAPPHLVQRPHYDYPTYTDDYYNEHQFHPPSYIQPRRSSSHSYSDYSRPYFEPLPPANYHPYPSSMRQKSHELLPIKSNRDKVAENLAKERPCRTLFVRNVYFEISEEVLRSLFEQFGEIRSFYNLLGKRGLAFISFYDLRAAEKAKAAMQDYEFNGRKIDVHFSLPKEDANADDEKCDATKNQVLSFLFQGTLLLTVKNPSQNITNEEVKELFSKFGELKCVRDFKTHVNQKFVEFFDSRDCNAAYNELLNTQFKNGLVDLRFVWDYPARVRKAQSVSAERTLHPSSRRISADHYEPPYSSRLGSIPSSNYSPFPENRDYHYDEYFVRRDPRQYYPEPITSKGNSKSRIQDEQEVARLQQAQRAQQMLAMAVSNHPRENNEGQPCGPSENVKASQESTKPPNSDRNIISQMNQLLNLLQQRPSTGSQDPRL